MTALGPPGLELAIDAALVWLSRMVRRWWALKDGQFRDLVEDSNHALFGRLPGRAPLCQSQAVGIRRQARSVSIVRYHWHVSGSLGRARVAPQSWPMLHFFIKKSFRILTWVSSRRKKFRTSRGYDVVNLKVLYELPLFD
jgi:nitrogen fixation-related uncharacterized protein